MDNQLTVFAQQNPYLTERNIDESTWNALCETIYPGAKHDSVMMAINYCASRGLDIMLKPVHIVPMKVKNTTTNTDVWRDVVMPGIGSYRVQADRSGTYAGADEPEFGPIKNISGTDKYQKPFTVDYPEWCKYTVYKLVAGQKVAFVAKEYWLENYASQSAGTTAPNSMWKKRPFAQLAKCAEAQSLRRAWPDVGSDPTMEEMEGKQLERNITPIKTQPNVDHTQPSKLSQVLSGEVSNPDEKNHGVFDELALAILSVSNMDELNEVGFEVAKKFKASLITPDERKSLGADFKKRQREFIPVDTETGEVA